jgi:peptidyl-tRNA hydrolase, PTH1 family
VAGLGNPGPEYENTPHNAGFAVVEHLAADLNVRFRRSFRHSAMKADVSREDHNILLVKPLSFMNLSGPVVSAMARKAGIEPEHVIIVSDDADLEIGRIRIKPSGGSGGHKGMKSVLESLGTEAVPRVRVGIGRGERVTDLVDFVLTPFSAAERKQIAEVVKQAAEAVKMVIQQGIAEAMNRCNGLKIGEQKPDK